MELIAKGQSATIPLSQGLQATLFWKTEVDFDLHVQYQSRPRTEKKLFGGEKSVPSETGHVYFADKGSKNSFPYISLDKDSGIGGDVAAGGNEENIHFMDLDKHDYILIYVNNFSNNTRFSKYDAKITLKDSRGNELIQVQVNSNEPGRNCVIAIVDNTGSQPVLKAIDETIQREPKLADYINR